MLVFYAVVMTRLFGACDECGTMRTRCAVALFASKPRTNLGLSEAVRSFGWQLLHEPIRITVLGGVLVLDSALFGSMLSIVVTYTIILMQFQQDEGNFNVLEDIY